jgi:hypothetical protein
MKFRRKKSTEVNQKDEFDKLDYPDLAEFDSFVGLMINSLYLQKGQFTFIACYSGLLLFIRGQGMIWIPVVKMKDVMKKADERELAQGAIVIGTATAATAAHAPLLPVYIALGTSIGVYNVYAETPPKIVISYLKDLILKVIIRKTKRRVLTGFNRRVPVTKQKRKSITKEKYILQIEIKLKFFDEVEKNKIEKFSDGLKSIFFNQNVPKFNLPLITDISPFIKVLELDEIPIKFIGITKKEILELQQKLKKKDNYENLEQNNSDIK